jgi:hypothetical protein
VPFLARLLPAMRRGVKRLFAGLLGHGGVVSGP